jgi:preprotein translocase subunit YajC
VDAADFGLYREKKSCKTAALPDAKGCLIGWSAVTVLGMYVQSAGGFAGLGSLGGLALPVVMIAAMYFLMIAPNQKKQKAWQEMLGKIKSGDKVTTNGGIRGTVLQVKDDVVIVRVQPDGVKLEFVKSSISAVTVDEKSV